jgi:hypothetical protein
MGGNALKNTNCIRINKDLYDKIKIIILGKLSSNCTFVLVKEMPEKETFGDLDLLYEHKEGLNIRDIVYDIFSPKEVFSNGDIFSFSYQINETDYFQIDLIKVKNINMSQLYFGYGDIGLILGRILKKNNLTFGHEGLWINYENQKIMMLDNPFEICNFLELDYNEWSIGFKTKIDVFKWIIQCKYFHKDYFKIETLNCIYKKNYDNRPNFKFFVDYISTLEIQPKELINYTVEDYIKIFNKESKKDEIDSKIAIIKLHQEKFNGQIFLKYTDAKNINKYKDAFKNHISQSFNFNEWLINNEIEIINNQIKKFIEAAEATY